MMRWSKYLATALFVTGLAALVSSIVEGNYLATTATAQDQQSTEPVLATIQELVSQLTEATEQVGRDRTLSTDEKIATALIEIFAPITNALRSEHLEELSEAYASGLSDIYETQPGYTPRFELASIQSDIDNINEAILIATGTSPENEFREIAERLTKLLVSESPPSAAHTEEANLRRARIQASPAAMIAREELLDALTGLNGSTGMRVHIISATYGDMRIGSPALRRCDATVAVSATCQASRTCAASSFNQQSATALCGYDPIPHAAPTSQSISIEYACIEGTRSHWDSLARNPYRNPITYDLIDGDGVQTVTFLRAENWVIRCSADQANFSD